MVAVLVKSLIELLQNQSQASSLYLVGGALRDEFWSLETTDFDFCIESDGGAEELVKQLASEHGGRAIPTGRGYPIWTWVWPEHPELSLQFADTQKEMFPDPSKRSRVSVFGSLFEDCERRDFTINMLYRRVSDLKTLDPSGLGLSDLSARRLRAHPKISAEKMFSDDPLRILRMHRFLGRWKLSADSSLLDAAKAQNSRLDILSPERLRDEFHKWMSKGHFEKSMAQAMDSGVLASLFGTSTQWSLNRLQGLEFSPPELQWAAVLQDDSSRQGVGKRLKWSASFQKTLGQLSQAIRELQSVEFQSHVRDWYLRYLKAPKTEQDLLKTLSESRPEFLSSLEATKKLGSPFGHFSAQQIMDWLKITPSAELGRAQRQLELWCEAQIQIRNPIDPLAARDWLVKTFKK
jgi:tRNA nucleotidyltransferase/poly(A) polymerase